MLNIFNDKKTLSGLKTKLVILKPKNTIVPPLK